MARKTIKVGEQDIDMVANAFTPVVYQKTFHKDVFLETQKKDKSLGFTQELAYVMMMQATDKTAKELTELTIDEFYAWLMTLSAMDIMLASQEILELFYGQTAPKSKKKKKA